MFSGCSSLKSVDLSSFDTGKMAGEWDWFDGIFDDCINLTSIHTPCHVLQAVALPSVPGYAWYLPDGTEVAQLPKNLSESVLLTRRAKEGAPVITTTTVDLNMEDVIRVKYVPYSYTVRTNNQDSENQVTFYVVEGRLAEGLQMYPATGEIYGVPLEAGEFRITVRADFSNPNYLPSYAELTLTVLENTDENIGTATDPGYEITQPVSDLDLGSLAGSGSHTVVSNGEYAEFVDVYLDGRRLSRETEYTSEAGSTRITITDQTFIDAGEGSHTLGIEFRAEETGELKRAAQNIAVTSTGSSGEGSQKPDDGYPGSKPGNNNGGSGNETEGGPEHTGGSGNDGGADPGVGVQAQPPREAGASTIIYTVLPGDNLWKIAVKFYGSGGYWRKIYEGNRAVITDPARIYAGQRLTILLSGENAGGAAKASGADGRKTLYRVAAGDSLWKISLKVYGNGRFWERLYRANQGKISNPKRIYAGQEILIPER